MDSSGAAMGNFPTFDASVIKQEPDSEHSAELARLSEFENNTLGFEDGKTGGQVKISEVFTMRVTTAITPVKTFHGQHDSEDPKKRITDNNLRLHMNINNGVKLLACKLCNYRTWKKVSLKAHQVTHLAKKPSGRQGRKASDNSHKKKIFKCDVCDHSSHWKANLMKHMMTHSRKKPLFECDICKYQASQERYLKMHMRAHKREKQLFKCDMCDDQSTLQSSLELHKTSHIGEKPFANEYQDQASNDSNLEKHTKTPAESQAEKIEREGTPKRLFVCDLCDYWTSLKRNFTKHNTSHTKEESFMCGFCDYETNLKANLIKHKKTHTAEKPFKCDDCDYQSSNKDLLHAHRRKHTGEKPFKCDVCNHRTSWKGNLTKHMMVHAKDEMLKYDVHSNQESYKLSLNENKNTHEGEKQFAHAHQNEESKAEEHMNISTEEKPLKCNYCDFQTLNKYQLRAHKRTHTGTRTGKKPFVCDVCGYSSSWKCNLIKHERIHTWEKKLFSCDVCDYLTRWKGNLTKHMKRAHTKDKLLKYDLYSNQESYKLSLNENKNTHEGEKQFAHAHQNEESKAEEHMNISTEEKPLMCNDCDFQTRNKYQLRAHKRNHTRRNKRGERKKKQFVCDVCGYRSFWKFNLATHQRIHTGEKKLFSCNVCDYKSTRLSALKLHKTSHIEEKPFANGRHHCNASNDSDLEKRMTNHAEIQLEKIDREGASESFERSQDSYNSSLEVKTKKDRKVLKCSDCLYQTYNVSHIRAHRRIHTGEKPFVCDLCDYSSSWKANLVTHEKTHSGEKPFVCDLCDYRTSERKRLTRHMIVHTGERPFACNLCKHTARDKGRLNRHMRTHAKEKPSYVCDVCEYETSNETILRFHQERRHCQKKIGRRILPIEPCLEPHIQPAYDELDQLIETLHDDTDRPAQPAHERTDSPVGTSNRQRCSVCFKSVPMVYKFRCEDCRWFWNYWKDAPLPPDCPGHTTEGEDVDCPGCRWGRYKAASIAWENQTKIKKEELEELEQEQVVDDFEPCQESEPTQV